MRVFLLVCGICPLFAGITVDTPFVPISKDILQETRHRLNISGEVCSRHCLLQNSADVVDKQNALDNLYNLDNFLKSVMPSKRFTLSNIQLLDTYFVLAKVDVEPVEYALFKAFRASGPQLPTRVMQECWCGLARGESPLRNRADDIITSFIQRNVKKTDTVRIADLGSGDLLSLFILINKLVALGYQNFSVSAIDLAYEDIIKRYKARIEPDNGIYTIKPHTTYFLDEERVRIMTLVNAVIKGDNPDFDEVEKVRDYIGGYRTNDALVAFINWFKNSGIDVFVNLYASAQDYSQDFLKKNAYSDAIVAVDVPFGLESAHKETQRDIWTDFNDLRTKTLTENGQAILISWVSVLKKSDIAGTWGVDIDALRTRAIEVGPFASEHTPEQIVMAQQAREQLVNQELKQLSQLPSVPPRFEQFKPAQNMDPFVESAILFAKGDRNGVQARVLTPQGVLYGIPDVPVITVT